jgi:N-acetyl-alpha-D-glucosaminyl L-malate synthase BshA
VPFPDGKELEKGLPYLNNDLEKRIMKIGIACYPTHGGSGVVASELSLALAGRGHEVHIVSYATPFRLNTYYENVYVHEVEVASYPLFKYPPYALSLATKLVDVTREFGLQILHSHYAVPHAASAYLAQKISRDIEPRTITTLHGTDITLAGTDSSFHEVIKFAIEESDGVTAVSEYLRRRTIREFDLTRDIRTIPNFIDIERFHPERQPCIRDRFADLDEKVLMHASNFRPVKRVADVVRVFERIKRKVPSKLLLVGEGPEKLFVQTLVKELDLTGSVYFLGQQDYMEELLTCADLFFLPSEQESFGLAALEALSCGVPVIASATGGLPEVVVEGENGFLCGVGEIQEMSERALELLTDADKLRLFKIQSRAHAVGRFKRDLIIPLYESYYEEILAQPS